MFVTDMFHPIDSLSVKLFLDGDVRHGRIRRGPVPMLLTRRDPDYISRADFLRTNSLWRLAASRALDARMPLLKMVLASPGFSSR